MGWGLAWLKNEVHQRALMILVIGLGVRLAIATWLPPGFDEAYYFTYTLHPNWSYFDHPPLVALAAALGPWLTGAVTQLTIRVGPLVLYTIALGLLYNTGATLFSAEAGLFALAIATISPILQVGFGVLVLPDAPLMVFWAAALYLASAEFFSQPSSEPYQPTVRLVWISLMVGLACLGKYHGFALGGGLVLFCLVNPRYRSVFTSPWMLLGVGLFGLSQVPVLYWNAQHHWISFLFQSSRGVPNSGYRWLDLLGVFLMHVAYLFPTIGFPLWWVLGKSILAQVSNASDQQPPAPNQDQPQRQQLILWLSLPVILIFTLMGGYRQILPTWPMPGFFGIALLLGQQATHWQSKSPKAVRRWLQGSAIAVASLMVLALSHIAFGTLQKPGAYAWFGGAWPVNQDPSTQLIDVRQLRQGFREQPQISQALRSAQFIFTRDFFLAGQVAMALAPISDRPVTCFSDDPRGFAFWSNQQQWLHQDGLYITSQRFQTEPMPSQRYGSYFRQIQFLGEVAILRGKTVTERFLVYQAKSLQKIYPWPYGLNQLQP